MGVQLAMYKGQGTAFNAAVRWKTKSQYSHCELVVRGKCYSSSIRDGGVRGKVIDLDPDKWDIYNLPWADPDAVLAWFIEHDGDIYGLSDLVLCQAFGLVRDGRGEFCSEACAKALGLRGATSKSPQGLLDACLDINKNTVFILRT